MTSETFLVPIKISWDVTYDRRCKDYDWRIWVEHEANLVAINTFPLISGQHKDKATAQKQMEEALDNLKTLLGIKENARAK